MKRLHNPFYIGQVRGCAVRFFRAPNDVVALPWHACADLTAAAALPDDLRTVFLNMTKSGQWQDSVRTVATDAGDVLIAPHFVAQGAMGAFQQHGLTDESFEDDWCITAAEAACKMQEGMSAEEKLKNIIMMGRQHLGREDDL